MGRNESNSHTLINTSSPTYYYYTKTASYHANVNMLYSTTTEPWVLADVLNKEMKDNKLTPPQHQHGLLPRWGNNEMRGWRGVTTPGPKVQMLQCRLIRHKSKTKTGFSTMAVLSTSWVMKVLIRTGTRIKQTKLHGLTKAINFSIWWGNENEKNSHFKDNNNFF